MTPLQRYLRIVSLMTPGQATAEKATELYKVAILEERRNQLEHLRDLRDTQQQENPVAFMVVTDFLDNYRVRVHSLMDEMGGSQVFYKKIHVRNSELSEIDA